MTIARKDIAKAFVNRAEQSSNKQAIKELAALILEARMHLEIDEIISDISAEYTKRYGVIEAQVKSPFALGDNLKTDIINLVKRQTKAKKVILHQQIDHSLLGGVVIAVPGVELDLSLKTKLSKLRV